MLKQERIQRRKLLSDRLIEKVHSSVDIDSKDIGDYLRLELQISDKNVTNLDLAKRYRLELKELARDSNDPNFPIHFGEMMVTIVEAEQSKSVEWQALIDAKREIFDYIFYHSLQRFKTLFSPVMRGKEKRQLFD